MVNALHRLRTRNIHFIFDWDGTITTQDTIGFMGKIAETKSTSESTWADLEEHYLATHRNHDESYEPKKAERSTIAEEREWLRSLRSVEESSTRKAEEVGLFKGVTAADVRNIAYQVITESEVAIRNGWGELLAEIDIRQKSQTPPNLDMVSIVSANWSQLFIMECLKTSKCPMHLSIPEEPGELRGNQAHTIRIYGNEIQGLHSKAGSSGLLCHSNGRDFRTSDDKSKWIQECNEAKAGDAEKPFVIYFGDSMGDFDALLTADLGVCIRNEPPSRSQQQLLETFERLDIHVPHIFDKGIIAAESIVWAFNFEEVAEAIKKS
ncbi:uncharacterized protein BDZ99DRAFT_462860 [Mytilinidion resinicola]|uniref:HAD-like protein n=1 Tax=Mytilinidion resinicola TaxID=574789 RepID=A0A6A6YNW7_9PEZI|nr:uncharacterized protein BDZ99DRAFT_462860 [Mytilinidion resinicola]KAF2810273.1 hypothetical protein BDZ99DRAFT_462860 [Mytilinidion resinicola]